MSNSNTRTETPNANTEVVVGVEDLPLHCPTENSRLWDSHPQVFLPIETEGESVCPYCGTRYILK